MPSCKDYKDCKDVEVKVAAKSGSPYMIYRMYKVKDGSEYITSPIIVSIFGDR